jgi:5-methylcytosine-specific restriction protein A
MPRTPQSTKCRELGCKNDKTARSAFCTDHGGGITEKGKENAKLYATGYWKQQRINQLSQKPLCASCLLQGKVVQATVVDHIFPHRQDSTKFKANNFQSLCVSCHTNKTLEENNGKYLYYSPNGIITYTEADYGKTLNQTEFEKDL